MILVTTGKVVLLAGRLISSLSTKLSTDSVDKIEKYFVNRDLAPMFRFHLRCMLQCMIFKQFLPAAGGSAMPWPRKQGFCPRVARKTWIFAMQIVSILV